MPDQCELGYKGELEGKLIIVEGKSTCRFIWALLCSMDVEKPNVENFGSITDLTEWLDGFEVRTGYRQFNALAIIRDAEANADGALKSISTSLALSLDIHCTLTHSQYIDDKFKVGAFILPDGKNPGMLETLCRNAVADDSAFGCVESYFECLAKNEVTPLNKHKAWCQAFLASRKEFVEHVGLAAAKDYWCFDSTEYDDLKDFLKRFIAL